MKEKKKKAETGRRKNMENEKNHLLSLYENEFRELLKNVVTFREFCDELITKNILNFDHLDKFHIEIKNKEFVPENLFIELFKIITNTRSDWILISLKKTGLEQCCKLAYMIINTWKRIIENLIIEYKTDYSTVPISPFHDGNPIPVERILTPMTIVKVNKTLLDEKFIKCFEESWNFLSIISDNCKRIIVRGPPGIGKTVHMRKLVNWWANSKGQKSNIELVIPLTLSKIKKGQTIIDAVWEQNNFNKFSKMSKDVLRYVFKVKGSREATRNKIIFFLDGADEFLEKNNEIFKILDGKAFPFPIIVWSREWRAHQIELTYDAIFQLCGFNEQQLEMYYIKCLDENRGRELVQYLKREKEDLFRVCSTPLLALLVWLVWKEPGNELSANHFLIYEQFVNILCSKMHINRKTKKFKKTLQFCYELAYKNLGKERIILNESRKGTDRLQHAVNYLGGLLRVIKINYTNEQYHSSSDEFQFFHLTIQEYFAAKYIISKSNHSLTDLLTPLCCGRFNFLSQLGKRLTDDNNVYIMLNVLRFVRALNKHIYDKLVEDNKDLKRTLDGVNDTVRKIINDGPVDYSLVVKDEELPTAIIKLLIGKYWSFIQKITLINAKANWKFLIKQSKSIPFKNYLQILQIKSNDALNILLKFLEVFEIIETIRMENNRTKLTFHERKLKIKSYGWNEPEVESLMTFVSLLNDIRSLNISVTKIENKYIPRILDSLRYPNKIQFVDLSNSYLSTNIELGDNDLMEEVIRIIRNFTNIEIIYLSNNRIFDQSISELFKVLSHPKNILHHLNANNCYFGSFGAEKLAKEMIHLTNLKILNLANNKIGSRGSICLFKAFYNCITNLEEFYAERCSIDSKGGEVFSVALQSLKRLKILNLSSNPIGTKSINKILGSIFRFNPNLENINIQSCNIDGEIIVFLAAVLEKLTNLKYLNISRNIINKMSNFVLFESMSISMNQFKYIFLNDNNIYGNSIEIFAYFLQNHPRLYFLDLSNNNLEDNGASLLFKTITDYNVNIEELYISNCNFRINGAEFLAEAVKNQPSLKIIDISYNNIEEEGAVVLFKAIALFCRNLHKLKVEKCKFGLFGAEYLALIVKKLEFLNTLIISHNNIGIKGAEILFKTISKGPNNTRLKELRFRECRLNSAAGEYFAQALCNLNSLKILDCSLNNFGDDSSSAILESLMKYCHKLEIALMENCNFGKKSFDAINNFFISKKDLKILNLSYNQLPKNYNNPLFNNLSIYCINLEEIHLENCQLNSTIIQQLSNEIKFMNTLKCMNISHNQLDGEDWKSIFSSLAESKNHIEKFQIQNCSLNEYNIDNLAVFLKKQIFLNEFNVSFNVINYESALNLSKSIACFCKECFELRFINCISSIKVLDVIIKLIIRLPNLNVLDLSLCKIENDGIQNLLESLNETDINLTELNLRHCNFNFDSLPNMIKFLKKQTLLQIFSISFNNIGDVESVTLFQCIGDFNVNLKELHVQGCGLGENSCRALSYILKEYSSPKLLNLSNNSVGNDGFQYIVDCFKQSCRYLNTIGLDDCEITNLEYRMTRELPSIQLYRKKRFVELKNY